MEADVFVVAVAADDGREEEEVGVDWILFGCCWTDGDDLIDPSIMALLGSDAFVVAAVMGLPVPVPVPAMVEPLVSFFVCIVISDFFEIRTRNFQSWKWIQ